MKRHYNILIAVGATVVGLVMIGMIWRTIDYQRILSLDYRTHSRAISRLDTIDIRQCAAKTKTLLQRDHFHIINEYQIDTSQVEIIAQTHTYWLFSDAFNKVTIIDGIARQRGTPDQPARTILVFSGSIRTGSRVYRWLVFLGIMTVVAVGLKKEYLPHVFMKDTNGNI